MIFERGKLGRVHCKAQLFQANCTGTRHLLIDDRRCVLASANPGPTAGLIPDRAARQSCPSSSGKGRRAARAIKENTEDFGHDLTADEQAALKTGDITALYHLGANPYLIRRVFRPNFKI